MRSLFPHSICEDDDLFTHVLSRYGQLPELTSVDVFCMYPQVSYGQSSAVRCVRTNIQSIPAVDPHDALLVNHQGNNQGGAVDVYLSLVRITATLESPLYRARNLC
jgi:hypothetical protein